MCTNDDTKQDLSRSLWISGLSSVTKAIDLKELFSHHGKVIGAKVVTSAKTPGSQCFGFVTMSSAEEALACIEKLHKTVLHEKTIQVEKAKTDPTPSKKAASKSKAGDRKEDEKSHSTRHSSKSSSRPSRRDERTSRRPRDEKRSESEKKHANDRTGHKKLDDIKRSTSKDSSKPAKIAKIDTVSVKSRSTSKEGDKNDVVVIEVDGGIKEDRKTAPVKEAKKDTVVVDEKKDDDKQAENKEENKEDSIKTLQQIRKERADKVDREHERKKKLRERERILRENRRREQEKREKERKERARKEAERVRKEREKTREFEKAREREREKEREHFLQERREREEKERKEREKEREDMEKERLERERLERERRERERLENERLAREKEEKDRLEKERMVREEHEFRIERERQRLEKERLERERVERNSRGVMVDRGLGSKRPMVGDDRRDYHTDAKRSVQDASPSSRKDFFSPTGNRNDASPNNQYGSDQSYEQRGNSRRDNLYSKPDDRGKSDAREARPSREDSRVASTRHESRPSNPREFDSGKDRGGYSQQSSDIRRVVQRETDTYSSNSRERERSPHRGSERAGGDAGSRYRTADQSPRSQNWNDSPNPNAPKTLSDVLGRAGLTGILGSRAEEKSDKFSPRMTDVVAASRSGGDSRTYNSSSNHDSPRVDRENDRVVDYREVQRDARVESRDTRRETTRSDDFRSTPRVDDRRDTRYEDRRPVVDDRPEMIADNRSTSYRRDERQTDYKSTRPADEFRDDRRGESRQDSRREPAPVTDNRRDQPSGNHNSVNSFNGDSRHSSLSMTDRRGLHPLAEQIGASSVAPSIIQQQQPRVLPMTDVFGRPLQQAAPPSNPAHALQAGYAAAAQGLGLQNVRNTGIQLNRNGRLEYTRMPTQPSNVSSIRRF